MMRERRVIGSLNVFCPLYDKERESLEGGHMQEMPGDR